MPPLLLAIARHRSGRVRLGDSSYVQVVGKWCHCVDEAVALDDDAMSQVEGERGVAGSGPHELPIGCRGSLAAGTG